MRRASSAALTSIIFIVVLIMCPLILILMNINLGFFFDYISNMMVANLKASAPLATVHILSTFSIY